MRYMLLIYRDEQALNDAERAHCYVESTQVAQERCSNGQFLATAPLYPTSTATSVRVREGKRLVTDGPFAVIEVAGLPEALLRSGQLRLEIESGPWGSSTPPCHKIADDF